MILGYLLLAAALMTTLAAGVTFFISQKYAQTGGRAGSTEARQSGWRTLTFVFDARHKPAAVGQNLLRMAKYLAIAAAVFVVSASVYLDYLIATHQFQVAYVAEYSARRSDARYLFAAFWGGQEGSILLWTFWTSILGAILAHKAGGKESRVWPVFALIQTFLIALVLIKCPFRVNPGPPPPDGRGLNPLLENQWMVIHPPILFLGFASLALPWVWSVYGLIYRDFDGWAKRVIPWTLFSFAVHGFGVALGGYWAYETLGWGGFWGWDPVEVSSLVPWLFLIGLLHGLIIQRANGGYKVSNLFLAILPFSFMCYGTFLTRTGLLSDFSVHSFSSMGKDGFYILLSEVIFAFVLPVTLLIARIKSIPKPAAYDKILTREFGFFIASAALAVLGLITAVGMSAPIITRIWLPKGAAAQPDFYNTATYPLALLILIGMAVTPYLTWRSTNASKAGAQLLPAYIVAVTSTVILFLCGGHKPWMLLIFAAAMFVMVTNISWIVNRIRLPKAHLTIGGFLAHAGAAMLLIGIVCLVMFSQQALHVTLVKDRPVEALGYRLTYVGMTAQPFDRKNALKIRVEKDGKSWYATPHLFLAPWEGKDTLFTNPPDIRNFIWGDLYIAHYRGPLSLDPKSPNNGVTMSKGDSFTYNGYQFKFEGLKWSDNVGEAMAAGQSLETLPQISIHANLNVMYQGKSYPLTPGLVFDNRMGQQSSVPAIIPGTSNAVITLDAIQPPFTGTFTTTNLPDPMQMIMIDVSTKPVIWLVWMGTLVYTIAGFIAYRRRVVQFRNNDDAVSDEDSAGILRSDDTTILETVKSGTH